MGNESDDYIFLTQRDGRFLNLSALALFFNLYDTHLLSNVSGGPALNLISAHKQVFAFSHEQEPRVLDNSEQ